MENFGEKIKNLPIWQQFVMVFVILALIVGVILFFSKPKEENKVILYQNLDANEALTIEKEITKMGLKATLNEDNTIIYVEEMKSPQIKAHLATMGLPSSGDPGFELMDEGTITETNYDKQKKYERALVGDIQKGLTQGFNFIEKAVVQLNYEEEESIFTEKEQESKASATIHTINNKELTEEQVAAIKNFIASSVKNLSIENVSVMDKNGIVYGEETTNKGSAAYTKQLQILSETEKRIEKDIMKMLDKNFGADNVSLIVRTEIKFDEIVQNIEKYDPQGTLVSRQEKNDNIVKRDGNSAQIVGTEANGEVPDYELEESNANGVLLSQEANELIENFEVGKTVETIKKNPELTNIQVTVTINENLNLNNNEEFIEEWQNLLANAAGIRRAEQGGFTNGSVEVSLQPFATLNTNQLVNDEVVASDIEQENIKENKKLTIVIFAMIGVAMMILAVLAWFMQKRKEEIVIRQSKNSEENGEEFVEEKPYIDEGKEKTDIIVKQLNKNQKDKKWDYQEFTEEQKELEKEYKDLVEENPGRATEYIKKLINEG